MPRLRPLQMKAFFSCLLFTANFETSCSVRCHDVKVAEGEGNYYYVCRYILEHFFKTNSTWRNKKCEDCSCYEQGMRCCSIVLEPVDYDTTMCQPIFHKDNCTYTVVEREDPAKPCSVREWRL